MLLFILLTFVFLLVLLSIFFLLFIGYKISNLPRNTARSYWRNWTYTYLWYALLTIIYGIVMINTALH